jgi:hypothetical protein
VHGSRERWASDLLQPRVETDIQFEEVETDEPAHHSVERAKLRDKRRRRSDVT